MSSAASVSRRVGTSADCATPRPSSAASAAAAESDREQDPAQAIEHAVHFVERAGDLQREPVGERDDDHADVCAGHRGVLEERLALARGDLQRALVHRQLEREAALPQHAPVGGDELDVAARLTELRRRDVREALVERPPLDLRRPLAKRLVDLSPQLAAHDEVHERSTRG